MSAIPGVMKLYVHACGCIGSERFADGKAFVIQSCDGDLVFDTAEVRADQPERETTFEEASKVMMFVRQVAKEAGKFHALRDALRCAQSRSGIEEDDDGRRMEAEAGEPARAADSGGALRRKLVDVLYLLRTQHNAHVAESETATARASRIEGCQTIDEVLSVDRVVGEAWERKHKDIPLADVSLDEVKRFALSLGEKRAHAHAGAAFAMAHAREVVKRVMR